MNMSILKLTKGTDFKNKIELVAKDEFNHSSQLMYPTETVGK